MTTATSSEKQSDGLMLLNRPWVVTATTVVKIVIIAFSIWLSLTIVDDMQTQEIIITANGQQGTVDIVEFLNSTTTITITDAEDTEATQDIDSPIVGTRVELVRADSEDPDNERNNVFVEILTGDANVEGVKTLATANHGDNISNIRDIPEFFNLGAPVQGFGALISLVPGIIAAIGIYFIWQPPSSRRANTGRYIGLAMFVFGFVLSLATLANQWGLYNSFELLVDGIMANGQITIGFAIAYALYWVGGKLFDEDSQAAGILDRIALGIAGLTLIALLLMSNILEGISFILSQYGNIETIITTIVAIIFGVLAYRLLISGDYFNETPDERTAWQGWLMLSPNIIGFSLFFAGPLLLSFYLSFTDSSVGQVPNFIGLQNYGEILSLEFVNQDNLNEPEQSVLSFGYTVLGSINTGDSRLVIGAKDTLFWISLRNTLVFCLLLLPLAIAPALALSLILNSKLPGMKFFRAIYFLPSVAAVVGTALIWQWLYNPQTGVYNYVITSVVEFLNGTFGFTIVDPQIEWLTDPSVVMFSMVFLAAWGLVGYNTVLFLAGLQGIPNTLYEAAMIDGANRWNQFRNVTLPMLAPTTFFVLITTIVTGLQVFNEPYTLFPLQPIPIDATTSVYYLYRRGFFFFEFGYASSIAWILFLIIFSITLIQFRLQRGGAYDN